MNPKKIVVSGFATLDYVVQLEEPFHGTGTVAGDLGTSAAWPRAGGAALYACRRIAAAGHRAFALTWIGDDGDGGHYLRACQRAQICCEAIEQRRAVRTPRCILIYRPDGDYGCILDTGSAGDEALTADQRETLLQADHVCISVGPPAATGQIIDSLPDDQPLSWIVKRDEHNFPPELCARIARRAQLIFCNASEREFVEASLGGRRTETQVIIETLGSAGVLIDRLENKRVVQANIVKAHDATGAGDTLAGEIIANLTSGHVDIYDAVQSGMEAARDLLSQRHRSGSTERL